MAMVVVSCSWLAEEDTKCQLYPVEAETPRSALKIDQKPAWWERGGEREDQRVQG